MNRNDLAVANDCVACEAHVFPVLHINRRGESADQVIVLDDHVAIGIGNVAQTKRRAAAVQRMIGVIVDDLDSIRRVDGGADQNILFAIEFFTRQNPIRMDKLLRYFGENHYRKVDWGLFNQIYKSPLETGVRTTTH